MGVLKIGGKLLSNMVHKPATRNYPAEPHQFMERTRGHVEFDDSNCILCNICGKKCPTEAIHVDKAKREMTINRMLCVQCSYCVDSCPKKCLSMAGPYTAPDTTKTIDTFHIPEREQPKKEEKAEAQ